VDEETTDVTQLAGVIEISYGAGGLGEVLIELMDRDWTKRLAGC
jgi:hypothetical protein